MLPGRARLGTAASAVRPRADAPGARRRGRRLRAGAGRAGPLFLGILQVALVLLVRNTLAAAASEGARYAATLDRGAGRRRGATRGTRSSGALAARFAEDVDARPVLASTAPRRGGARCAPTVPALGLGGPGGRADGDAATPSRRSRERPVGSRASRERPGRADLARRSCCWCRWCGSCCRCSRCSAARSASAPPRGRPAGPTRSRPDDAEGRQPGPGRGAQALADQGIDGSGWSIDGHLHAAAARLPLGGVGRSPCGSRTRVDLPLRPRPAGRRGAELRARRRRTRCRSASTRSRRWCAMRRADGARPGDGADHRAGDGAAADGRRGRGRRLRGVPPAAGPRHPRRRRRAGRRRPRRRRRRRLRRRHPRRTARAHRRPRRGPPSTTTSSAPARTRSTPASRRTSTPTRPPSRTGPPDRAAAPAAEGAGGQETALIGATGAAVVAVDD